MVQGEKDMEKSAGQCAVFRFALHRLHDAGRMETGIYGIYGPFWWCYAGFVRLVLALAAE